MVVSKKKYRSALAKIDAILEENEPINNLLWTYNSYSREKVNSTQKVIINVKNCCNTRILTRNLRMRDPINNGFHMIFCVLYSAMHCKFRMMTEVSLMYT